MTDSYMFVQRKHLLVTGIGGGIAPRVAKAFRDAGAQVTGIDIRTREELTEEVTLDHFFSGDVSDLEFCERVVAEAGAEVPIDVVVNCAAFPQEGTLLHEMTAEQWQREVAVNLGGAWTITRAAVPHLIEHGGGAIVHFASTSAVHPRIGAGGYSVSKAGVLALTRAQALELAPHKISVNAVIPGAIRTRQFAINWGFDDPDEAFKHHPRPIPSGTLVDPDQVASAVFFFAQQAGASVTGSSVLLDGGYTI